MIVKRTWSLISYTLLPIPHLTIDAERIDREYTAIRSRREKVRLFGLFKPEGFLTGPARIIELDAAHGSPTMEVPDCAWHIRASAESPPNPDTLLEKG